MHGLGDKGNSVRKFASAYCCVSTMVHIQQVHERLNIGVRHTLERCHWHCHEGRTRVVVQRLVVGPQEGIASVQQVEQPLGSRTRALLSGGQQAANSVPASGSGSGGGTPRRRLPRAAPWLRRPPRALTGSGFSPCPVSAAAGGQESKLRSVAQGGGQQTAGSARAWQLQVLWGRPIMRSAFLTGSFARLLCSCR